MKTVPVRHVLRGAHLMKPRLTKVTKRHESYTCGIPPLPPKPRLPPPPPPPLPAALVRPPCYPGQARARQGPCHRHEAWYCPADRLRCKYPAFSDNIDFVPSGSKSCWWTNKSPECKQEEEDQLVNLTL